MSLAITMFHALQLGFGTTELLKILVAKVEGLTARVQALEGNAEDDAPEF